MFNKNEVGTAQFRIDTANETITDLLKVERVRRRRLALMSRFLVANGAYTRSFCEFIGKNTINNILIGEKNKPSVQFYSEIMQIMSSVY